MFCSNGQKKYLVLMGRGWRGNPFRTKHPRFELPRSIPQLFADRRTAKVLINGVYNVERQPGNIARETGTPAEPVIEVPEVCASHPPELFFGDMTEHFCPV